MTVTITIPDLLARYEYNRLVDNAGARPSMFDTASPAARANRLKSAAKLDERLAYLAEKAWGDGPYPARSPADHRKAAARLRDQAQAELGTIGNLARQIREATDRIAARDRHRDLQTEQQPDIEREIDHYDLTRESF